MIYELRPKLLTPRRLSVDLAVVFVFTGVYLLVRASGS
jgi:hypothetical protein